MSEKSKSHVDPKERETWQAVVDTDDAVHRMLPIEAHIASVKYLALRLLELTEDAS